MTRTSLFAILCLGALINGCSDDASTAAATGAGGVAGASGGSGSSGSGGAGGSSSGGSATGGSAGGGSATGGSVSFETGAYRHVKPADVGVHVGVGVVAPAPTEMYAGPLTIDSPTLIENVVIDGCLRIESDDVVLRNVRVTCDGLYPVRAEGATNTRIEHSTIECQSDSKVFYVLGSQGFQVRFSDVSGCEDFFFVAGNVEGLTVEHNYMHHLNLTASSHADGFQIGEVSDTTGNIRIAGNWIGPEADGGKTDTLFATNQCNATIVLENNFFKIWGLRTLRCGGETTSCTARTNVYEQGFEVLQASGGKRLFYQGTSSGSHVFECNRLEDGTLAPETVDNVDRVAGADHLITGCPDFPTD